MHPFEKLSFILGKHAALKRPLVARALESLFSTGKAHRALLGLPAAGALAGGGYSMLFGNTEDARRNAAIGALLGAGAAVGGRLGYKRYQKDVGEAQRLMDAGRQTGFVPFRESPQVDRIIGGHMADTATLLKQQGAKDFFKDTVEKTTKLTPEQKAQVSAALETYKATPPIAEQTAMDAALKSRVLGDAAMGALLAGGAGYGGAKLVEQAKGAQAPEDEEELRRLSAELRLGVHSNPSSKSNPRFRSARSVENTRSPGASDG